jgi:hypothetical protein
LPLSEFLFQVDGTLSSGLPVTSFDEAAVEANTLLIQIYVIGANNAPAPAL